MVLYALSVAAIDWVSEGGQDMLSTRSRIIWRLGMAIAFLLLAIFGTGLSPLMFIIIAAVILAVQVLAEVLAAWLITESDPVTANS